MNWKHLFWIIPLCLVLGGFIGINALNSLINWTAWELTALVANKLEDARLAWTESHPYSNYPRIISSEGDFCYQVDNSIICPKRNLTDLGFNDDFSLPPTPKRSGYP